MLAWARTVIGLVLALGSQFGCGSATTKILPLTGAEGQQTIKDCARVFPRGAFEATHVVEASIPFSNDASLIGVVSAEANQRDFRSLLMTQEGMVLFDAVRRADNIEVVRALPPIDPSGFGRNMTDDVRLILTRPSGSRLEVGRTEKGTRLCRWSGGEEQIEVRLLGPREAYVTRIRGGSISRTAHLRDIDEQGFARDILLETTAMVGYQLHLTLLTADKKPQPLASKEP